MVDYEKAAELLIKKVDELRAEKKGLKKVIEAAISQHHRVRPNTVVDILIREYEALKGGE